MGAASSHACPACDGTGLGGFRHDGGRLMCRACIGSGQRTNTVRATGKSAIQAWAERFGVRVIGRDDLPPHLRGFGITHVHLDELGGRS